jgi:carbonic anhydrase
MYTYKLPKGALRLHECEALVLTCMDFRFWEGTLTGFVKDALGMKYADITTVPGVCKGVAQGDEVTISHIRRAIDIALEKHHIRKVPIIHHSTCGAYGINDKKAEFETQCANLKKGAKILAAWYPALSFSAFFAQGEEKEEYDEITYLAIEI